MEHPSSHIDPLDGISADRRRFLKTVLAGTTVAVPIVVSMTLTGASRAPQAPGVSGATTLAPGNTTVPDETTPMPPTSKPTRPPVTTGPPVVPTTPEP